MARYFFHVINGEFLPDPTGAECETLDQVKGQAVCAAEEMLEEQALQLWRTRHWDMYVTDENNKTLLKLSFTAEDLTDHTRDR